MKKAVLIILGVWMLGFASFLTLASLGDARSTAIMSMTWGLILGWVVVGGLIMYRNRERVRSYVQKISLDWRITFVLFATMLALVEEIITVSLTNLAPLFGARVGEAYITASANYFDVVLFHSVVVFIPLFIAWAIVLSRYDFKPFAVFLLFGIMGIFAEVSLDGPQQFLGFGQWIFVYGLMVFLPAYCLPPSRGAKPVRFWHYLVAIPLVFLIALPIIIPIVYVIAGVLQHPSIHFMSV